MRHYITHQYKHPLEKNPKEEPRKKADHTIDCLRYLALTNPHYGTSYDIAEDEEGKEIYDKSYPLGLRI